MGAPEKFLGMSYWDREKEIEDIVEHIDGVPNSILFVFGPKSSGKSTTMMKLVSESKKDKVFFYYDLRASFIVTYQDFLNQFFIEKGKRSKEIVQAAVNVGLKSVNLFEVSRELMDKIRNKEADEFKIMEAELERLKSKGKKPIIVIDELQVLKNVYANGGKGLLEKLFNFFVTITKSKHLAHVICMSSDSLFIEEVYNNSILEKTSKFYLFDSFDKETTVEWLAAEGVNEKAARKVYDKVGGECWYLQEYLKNPQSLEDMVNLKVSNFYSYLRMQDVQKRKKVISFLKHFKKRNFVSTETAVLDEVVMRELVNREILFYDPLNKLVKPQSRLMLNVLRKVV